MPLKLTEMDTVIREIYFKIMFEKKGGIGGGWGRGGDGREGGGEEEGDEGWLSDSLVVVVSDHGMTWMGGHGGGTEEETAAFVAFLTPNIAPLKGWGEGRKGEGGKGVCFYSEELMEQLSGCSFEKWGRKEKGEGKGGEREGEKKGEWLEEVNQLDVAPTISALMGVDPPKGGEGRVIVKAMGGRKMGEVVKGLGKNINQLYMKLVEEGRGEEVLGGEIEEEWEEGLEACEECLDCLMEGEGGGRRGGCRRDCEKGIDKVEKLVGRLLELEGGKGRGEGGYWGGVVGGVVGMSLCLGVAGYCFFLFSFPFLFSSSSIPFSFSSFFPWVFLLFSLFHLFTLFSSSLIEEEHQTVYFFTTTVLLLLLSHSLLSPPSLQKENRGDIRWNSVLSLSLLLFLHSLSRRWNHCGVKILEIMGGGEGGGDVCLTDSGLLSSSLRSLSLSPSLSFLPPGGVEGGLVVFCGVLCVLFFLFFLSFLQKKTKEGKEKRNEARGEGKRERMVLSDCLEKNEKMITFFLLLLVILSLSTYHTLQEGGSRGGEEKGDGVISAISVARFVYFVSFLCLLWGWELGRRYGRGVWVGWLRLVVVLLLFLLHRPWNLPLLVILFVQTTLFVIFARHHLLSSSSSSSSFPLSLVLSLFFWLSHSSFFYFGVSNSLSSIDFVGSYAGLSSFSYFLNPLLSFLILFSGPLIYILSILELLFLLSLPPFPKREKRRGVKEKRGEKEVVICVAWGGIVRRFWYCLCVCVVVVVFQNHLFCWSVFAPKLVFEWFWVVFDCLCFLVVVVCSW